MKNNTQLFQEETCGEKPTAEAPQSKDSWPWRKFEKVAVPCERLSKTMPRRAMKKTVGRGTRHKSHALSGCNCKVAAVLRAIRRVVAAVNYVYDTSFPVPDFVSCRGLTCDDAFRQAKKFFSGLLDGLNKSGDHQWLPLVRRLSAKKRLEVASSLCSGKTLLPDPCPLVVKKMEAAHKGLLSEQLVPRQDFLSFARSRVRKMFRRGWDEGYADCVERSTLPLSAGIGLPRSAGGVASCGMSRTEYVRACLGGDCPSFPLKVKYATVVAKGKARGITVTHAEHSFLRPLHSLLYSKLPRSWLLRGDATVEKLSEMTVCGGEVFVSGDYESATDGLSTEVSETILEEILNNCEYVPDQVRVWALASLRSEIEYSDGSTVQQRRGQLMGSLLSFPLLCLYNYLAFKFFVRRKVPVRINGDDILFRATPAEYERWRDGIGELGLKLSAGKTFVHPRYMSVNSTYFWSHQKRVERLSVLRLGMLKSPESPMSLGNSHNDFVRPMKGAVRRRSSVLFLRTHKRLFKSSGRSLLLSRDRKSVV